MTKRLVIFCLLLLITTGFLSPAMADNRNRYKDVRVDVAIPGRSIRLQRWDGGTGSFSVNFGSIPIGGNSFSVPSANVGCDIIVTSDSPTAVFSIYSTNLVNVTPPHAGTVIPPSDPSDPWISDADPGTVYYGFTCRRDFESTYVAPSGYSVSSDDTPLHPHTPIGWPNSFSTNPFDPATEFYGHVYHVYNALVVPRDAWPGTYQAQITFVLW